MQSAIHPAFAAKIAVLAALLERSQTVRTEAHIRLAHRVPQYQALFQGGAWDVLEINTGLVKERGLSYAAAMQSVDAMESKAARQ